MKNSGDLPQKNIREIDREKTASLYGWTVREIYDSAQAFKALYRRQPASTITFREYLDLLKSSGLRPDDVALSGGFHLSRLNDEGAYSIGNCRFIPGAENVSERREGYQGKPEFRSAMSVIAKTRQRLTCTNCGKDFSPGMFARWHGALCRAIDPARYP